MACPGQVLSLLQTRSGTNSSEFGERCRQVHVAHREIAVATSLSAHPRLRLSLKSQENQDLTLPRRPRFERLTDECARPVDFCFTDIHCLGAHRAPRRWTRHEEIS